MTDASELAAARAWVAELEAENRRLRAVVRVNLLRHVQGVTHAQIDEMLAAPAAQRDVLVVPRDPDREMIDAGCQAMRRRKEAMGDDWVRVSNREKMHIRWKAMLDNWSARAERAP